ncbi:Protein of unknown function [Pyronema omphalodes CBS 100304]|uniref:Uncharacterized protein n=1 Tax=Pyronema omphalodes (strain CBS 100304) TaxID=1076935 RepID=U4LC93_PYROM|nr:Protein of unknown function [Pyronema omphalodes CBS 100304]
MMLVICYIQLQGAPQVG